MFSVAEIMTRKPHALTPEDTLLDARKMMAEHHIRHVPIVSPDGYPVGIVSQRDVLGAADSNLFRDQAGADAKELYVSLSSVMTSPVQTVEEDASLRGAAMLMQKQRMGALPVVKDNQLVGIITDSDFVSIAINLMEQLEAVEPEDSDFDEFEDAT
jgi:CBS domain-containing protein